MNNWFYRQHPDRRGATIIGVLVLLIAVLWYVQPEQPVFAQASSPCNQTVAISVAAAASQTIAAAVQGTTTYVCALVISADTLATTATFSSGSTALTGAMRLCDECSISSGNGNDILFQTNGAQALTLAAVTGAITGYIRIGRN